MTDFDRRSLLALGSASLVVAATQAYAAEEKRPPAPRLTLAFSVRVLIGAPMDLGMIDGIRKRVIPITGGTVEGPRLTGTVVPGGADWQNVLPDGAADIWARYTLKASDGTLISVINPGYRRGPAEVLARVGRGESVDPALYYFRTTPRFETASASPYAWLMRSVFVCSAGRYADHVELDIYEVG